MTTTLSSIGIDVSKLHLDIHCYPCSSEYQCENQPKAISSLIKKLPAPEKVKRIVVESTGGYEQLVLVTLIEAGYPVSLVNPRNTRCFAQSLGETAKTDKIDAKILALFGDKMEPHLTALQPEEQEKLSALIKRRSQLQNMLTAEKNRLEKMPKFGLDKNIKKACRFLEKEMKAIAESISLILKSEVLKERYQVLTGVKGVGDNTAAILLAELPELGRLDKRKIAKLVGVAPVNHDSGMYRGHRKIKGGRTRVRNVLYMATMVAVQFNQEIKAYFQKLKDSGKKPKVAIVAAMHKLLNILNGRMHNFYAGNEVF